LKIQRAGFSRCNHHSGRCAEKRWCGKALLRPIDRRKFYSRSIGGQNCGLRRCSTSNCRRMSARSLSCSVLPLRNARLPPFRNHQGVCDTAHEARVTKTCRAPHDAALIAYERTVCDNHFASTVDGQSGSNAPAFYTSIFTRQRDIGSRNV